ncbi:hypothetical protein K435DRAFT_862910 [Dendrothele bispora CBS 962.96]|uniref:Uncharacterized protein n=1 Tax=Dendrothele bispora (strain CBS 962.96) TaxID=1314807 RepID=A0A4S8LSI7_DENBC|nr:hypothetical protein K435DRAFT_862910 [Dendrothele bispora CBS 962.96]
MYTPVIPLSRPPPIHLCPPLLHFFGPLSVHVPSSALVPYLKSSFPTSAPTSTPASVSTSVATSTPTSAPTFRIANDPNEPTAKGGAHQKLKLRRRYRHLDQEEKGLPRRRTRLSGAQANEKENEKPSGSSNRTSDR